VSSVVHFGIDDQGVLAALAANGYTIHECGTSIARFNDALKNSDIDAVVVEPGIASVRGEIVVAALSRRSVPWVLFREVDYPSGAAAFDLVIPRGIPSSAWLKAIEQLIERSHTLQSRAKLLCDQAASLRQTARSALKNSHEGKVEGEYRRRSKAQKILKRVIPSFNPRQPKTSALGQPITRVVVVDDQDPWRRMMCRMLQYNRGLQVIGQAADGAEAVEIVGRLCPDLILLDIQMPGMSGLEAAEQIIRADASAKIIILTSDGSGELVAAAFAAGAIGYVLKTDAGRELDSAVEAALQGNRFVSSRLLMKWQTTDDQ